MINLRNLKANANDVKEIIIKYDKPTIEVNRALKDSCPYYWYEQGTKESRKYHNECSGRECSECKRTAFKELKLAFLNEKKNNLGEW